MGSAKTRYRPRGSSLYPALVAVAGVLAYANSFSGVFVFDDLPWIVRNAAIRDLWPPWETTGGTLRPLLFYSLAVNYAISGLEVWSYHAANLVVHVLAGLVLFGVVRRTLAPARGQAAAELALVIATLWVVHPLQTQSVTYIIQRGESLAGLAFVVALYCVLRGARVGQHPYWWYAGGVLAYLCGLGTKETMVTAGPLVLAYDTVFLAGSVRRAVRQRWGLYMALAAPLVLGGAALLLTNPARLTGLISGDSVTATRLEYAASQPGVILHYLQLAFWPHPLCLDYGWPAAAGWGQILGPALVIVPLMAATLWALWRRSPLGFVGAWFFLILAPTSSLVPLRDLAVEHRMYLPLAAVVTVSVLVAHGLLIRGGPARYRRWLAGVLAGSAILACGALTVRRNTDYHSEVSIWGGALRERPWNAKRFYNLGLEFCLSERGILEQPVFAVATGKLPQIPRLREGLAALGAGEYARASQELDAVVHTAPEVAVARTGLGIAGFLQGDVAGAVRHFRISVELAPTEANSHANLGTGLLALGDSSLAVREYQEALRLNPSLAEAHHGMGTVRAAQGRGAEALVSLERAVHLRPAFPEALNNLASVLAAEGRGGAALDTYRRALARRPEYGLAHLNIGLLLLDAHRYAEAVRHLEGAVNGMPGSATAHGALGIARYSQGRMDVALKHFRAALELRPGDAEAHNNLANCVLAMGDVPVAVAEYRRAQRADSSRAGIAHNLGKALYALGHTPQAALAFRRALDLRPGDAGIRANLEAARSTGRSGQRDSTRPWNRPGR